MQILRGIFAILAGYLIFAVSAALLFSLTHHNPHQPATLLYEILTTIYGAFFAALGGYAASRLAPRRGLFHAAILSCLLAAIALISLFVQIGQGSNWTQIAAVAVMAPAVMIGAMIRLKGI